MWLPQGAAEHRLGTLSGDVQFASASTELSLGAPVSAPQFCGSS
jgi:hypothetical protein